MRKQFVKTLESILENDKKVVLLLGDIGVWGFRDAFKNFPRQICNIGILEQSTIGVAAGMAMEGMIPVVHTIAPFLVERAYEQLKDDFGYQKLGGNFVSVGASYDYAALGCTHHCPADIGVLNQIPGMEIILPGTAEEFDLLFKQTYNNGHPTYFRLSESKNTKSYSNEFARATLVRSGKLATVIAIGPMLDDVISACDGLDVTILYYTTVAPFDAQTLKDNFVGGKVLVCEPYYSGVLNSAITNALFPQSVILDCCGVPKKFLTDYGTSDDHDLALGLNSAGIKARVENLIVV